MTEDRKISISSSDVKDAEDAEDGKDPKKDESGQVEDSGASTGEVVINDDEEPDIDDQEVMDPVDEIAELENQLKSTQEKYLRGAADMDNLRKRSRRDVEEAGIRGRQEVLREILPVIDSIDLALNSAQPDGANTGIIQGVEMVRKQFLSATEQFGLKPIESVGQVFDPNFHEAVAQIPSDEVDAGLVLQEMRKGYILGDRLLRAAMVVVSKGQPEDSEPVEEDSSDEADEVVPDSAGDNPDNQVDKEDENE